MKLAIFQDRSPFGSEASALASIRQSLTACASFKVDYAVFPELFLNGYNSGDPAWATLDVTAKKIGSIAKDLGCGVVVGFAEKDASNRYNSAIAVDDQGQLRCHHRKIQLFGKREKELFRPGSRIPTFAFGKFKIAILICYDVEFAGHVEALSRESVDVILVPTANMLPYSHVPSTVVPALAANYGVTIAYANYCGCENEIEYTGGSTVVGPAGEAIVVAGKEPALLICETPDVRSRAEMPSQASEFRHAAVR